MVIIGVGSSLAGEYEADYDTPGSESKAASDLTEKALRRATRDRRSTSSGRTPPAPGVPAHGSASTPSSPTRRRSSTSAKHAAIRVSEDGKIGSHHPAADGARLGGQEGGRREADRGRRGEQRRRLQIKLGGDPIYAAQEAASPEGLGFLGAAIVLLIAFGSVVAAGLPLVIALVGLGISSGGLIVLLANVVDVPDWTTARLGADRDRGRNRLLAAGSDPLPLGPARRQGPPRRRGRGRDHRRAQRDHRRRHRGHRRARARASPACPTCTAWPSRPRSPCSR